jgi:hypothetical protein
MEDCGEKTTAINKQARLDVAWSHSLSGSVTTKIVILMVLNLIQGTKFGRGDTWENL